MTECLDLRISKCSVLVRLNYNQFICTSFPLQFRKKLYFLLFTQLQIFDNLSYFTN